MPNSKSSDSKDSSNCRRLDKDQERDKSVYRYLLECLTDLEIKGENSKPNESSIAKQWGQQENRIFIRRVLRSVFPRYYETQEKKSVTNIPVSAPDTVPGLTLGKLVKILSAIQKYKEEKIKKVSKLSTDQIPQLLSRTDKLRTLRKFFQLDIEEKQSLRLPTHPGETLLQELFDTVTDPVKGLKPEDIIILYKKAKKDYHALKKIEFNNEPEIKNISQKDAYQKKIQFYVTNILQEHCQGLDSILKQQKIEDLVSKLCREISRIELQCGLRQVKDLLNETKNTESLQENSIDLPGSFVEHLTRSTVENEILTDEFPINIKYFEIQKVQPLSLHIKTENNQNGLLNSLLINGNEEVEDVTSLQTQFAYKVTVHFYIKVPDDYKPKFRGLYNQSLFNENDKRLEFFEEITGVGSPTLHITAIINRVLLWNIAELKEYFPTPRNILKNNEFFSSHNFPNLVWSYNLVNLCKNTDIQRAVKENKIYDEVVGSYEPAYGEFCGFDVVEVAVKAAFYARLRAIKQAGINAKKYLMQLCHRVEEINSLRKAQRYLSYYPFSLTAMEGHLNQTLFKDKYRTRNNQFEFSEIEHNQPWSAVAYDAHLIITEAYLKEGLYRIAKKYLDVLKPHVEEAEKGDNKFFNDLMLAKYKICQFRYHCLTDLEDSEYSQSHSERFSVISAAINSLNDAEEHLKKLLKKYHALGNSAQSNFHQFFYLLSRVYFHRAKVYIFDSPYTDRPVNHWDGLVKPLRLLEKARIYAARDGNSIHYAYWSANQSWYYLMVAYLNYDQPFSSNQKLTREECIDWAKRLRKHALICYMNHGNDCFHAIKDNGGKLTDNYRDNKYYEDYDDIQIQVVPFIQELQAEFHADKQHYDRDKNVINLDFSILKQPHPDANNKSIYLFGTHSSILLFAMGMLELCEDIEDENELESKIKKAIRMFTYCSAIAEDGIDEYGSETQVNKDNETLCLDRIFHNGDSVVRGLYPHRLTQFADLGKIWVATCKSILYLSNSISDWPDIDRLLDTLPNGSTKQILGNTGGQKRYNGHIASHCKKVCQYFDNLRLKTDHCKQLQLIDIRNKVVRDIFKIMRGESDVSP